MRLAFFASAFATCVSLAALDGSALAAPLPLRLGDSSTPLLEPALAEPSAGQIVTLAHDVTLDPTTGDVSGATHATLHARLAALSTISLVLDSGLAVVDASAFETSVLVEQHSAASQRLVSLTLAPALPAGRVLDVSVRYQGRLACLPDGRGISACRVGGEMPFVREGSAFAHVPGSEGAERLLVLRRASRIGAVASGELLLERDDGATRVSHWFDPGTAGDDGQLVVLGDLSSIAALGTAPQTTVSHVVTQTASAQSLALSATAILPFVARATGQALPFPSLAIVEVPQDRSLFHATRHGLVVVSNAYAERGPQKLEEALAHELLHLWWGTLVSPADGARSTLLTEGLATLGAIDFIASAHHADEREAYLARRFREHELLLRYSQTAGALPAPILADAADVPASEPALTIWAYISSSATLEHLRVAVGEPAFEAALRRYADECRLVSCATEDFFEWIEEQSGVSLDSFIEQLVRSSAFPSPAVGFEQLDAHRVRVHFAGIDGLALPLELWVEEEDGRVIRRHVIASSEPLELAVEGPVRRVRPNPRHDAIVWSRSAVPGDVDFDGEVDGADVLHCAWRSGRVAEPNQNDDDGFFGFDLEFDPRCDSDGNAHIDNADLAELVQRFGTLRKEWR